MNKIPKILHISWFGKNEMPDLIKKCKESWYKHCSDYEIKIWNEDNFNVDKFKYAKQAYEQKKYAFVSDFCRVWALKQYGGISIDADVEILRPFSDELLSQRAFTSRESSGRWISAVFASEKNHPWIRKIYKYYDGRNFEYNPSKITNTVIIDEINKKLYKETVGENICLYNDVVIYPRDYFECKNWSTGKIEITDRSFCVHHYTASWLK